MTHYQDAYDGIRAGPCTRVAARSTFGLADDAGVSTPDSMSSPGGDFLDTVRLSVLDAMSYQDDPTDVDENDMAHEVADGAVPVYTHTRMMALVDLAAYYEDISDFGEPGDMITAAGWSLYQVGLRLAYALIAELQEAAQEDEDDDE